MNYWVTAFPFLMFLASIGTSLCSLRVVNDSPTNANDTAMGVAFIYQVSQPVGIDSGSVSFGTPYYSISLSLNVILTLMIVTRLVLSSRNFRNAMGAPAGACGLYKAIVSMLVESCALYAVSYLLFVVPWALESSVSNTFFPILAEVQVRTVGALQSPDVVQLTMVMHRSSPRS